MTQNQTQETSQGKTKALSENCLFYIYFILCNSINPGRARSSILESNGGKAEVFKRV